MRTCVGCRVRALAGELLRVAVVDGELVLDLRRRIGGRGAWLHPDLDCLTKAERRRAFTRALRVPGPLDATEVRTQLEQLAHRPENCRDAGVSRVTQEDSVGAGPEKSGPTPTKVETGPEKSGPTPTRKQVDPS